MGTVCVRNWLLFPAFSCFLAKALARPCITLASKYSAVFSTFSFSFGETGMELPSKMDELDIDSIGARFTERVGARREVCNTCISADSHGDTVVLTWAPNVPLQLRNKVKCIAKGFIAAGILCWGMPKLTHR